MRQIIGLVAVLLIANQTKAQTSLVWPPSLRPGDTIQLIAPSGPVRASQVKKAARQLEALGYHVKIRDDVEARYGYLAGSDERRAEELNQAFADPEVDGVFPLHGGYGAMRILDHIDYGAIRANPKAVVGFSDTTALHLAINRQAGLVTFHSPAPLGFFGQYEGRHPTPIRYFNRAVFSDDAGAYVIEIPDDVAQPTPLGQGRATGRLVGGNLSLVSALEGTPYAIDCRDAVLLIEDVREAPYRIDRMLRQLKLAGKLDQLRGAVLGAFTRNYDREEDQMTDDARFTVDGVLKQYFENAGIPVLMNFPVGHQAINVTLPLGGLVEVDAEEGVLRVLARAEK